MTITKTAGPTRKEKIILEGIHKAPTWVSLQRMLREVFPEHRDGRISQIVRIDKTIDYLATGDYQVTFEDVDIFVSYK